MIGNIVGFNLIRKEFGISRAISIVVKMQLRLLSDDPFKDMNLRNPKLSWNERSSQKQIAPAFSLYDVLIEEGYSQQEAFNYVEKVVVGVAKKFLEFSVPVIQYRDVAMIEQDKRIDVFARIVSRFPNAMGELKFDGIREYRFTVNKCLFASYCNTLGYKNLASIFCKADKLYFEEHQPYVDFSRMDTLAVNHKPCDFSFELIESNIIARG